MDNNLNILLIPTDDRPVSYLLPLHTGEINKNINIFIPPRGLLGNLQKSADIAKIFEWLEELLSQNKIDYAICALDTIAYGGLIPSRRVLDSKEEICLRLESFRKIVEPSGIKVLGFSSIMRISDSNINEEEKPYWDRYGKLIFEYSCLSHKGEDYSAVKAQIPPEILDDYLKTRERNFSINKMYLEWMEQGFFEFLMYAKDDTAPFCLNVQEAEILAKKASVHTGFDEAAVVLLTRVLVENYPEEIRIFPVYSTPNGAEIIPRYEDKPLRKTIESHINLCGTRLAESREVADIILLVHTPEKAQNDLALDEFVEPENREAVDFCIDFIKKSDKPVILADVKNANGADELLVRALFSEKFDIYGYAGWNTASNTIGSALSMGIARYTAEKTGCFSFEAFNKLLFIRFADDWAYQAIIRNMVRRFNLSLQQVGVSFPWNRSFEVEINI